MHQRKVDRLVNVLGDLLWEESGYLVWEGSNAKRRHAATPIKPEHV